MQRSTLFCVVSVFAICLAVGSAAADDEPRDIAALKPDYLPLVPVVMSRAGNASTTPAVASRVHYVAESPATASRAHYVGESPAKATTAYYVTKSPAALPAVSPASTAPVLPLAGSGTVPVTRSPVTTSGCACGTPTLTRSYAGATPVVPASVESQPLVPTAGNPWAVVSAARPIVGSCSPCSSPTTVCSPSTCTTGMPVVAYRPVVPPLPPRHRFGRGLIGQPVVYVDGQPVRNALRWFFP